jgi:hypothetical protein
LSQVLPGFLTLWKDSNESVQNDVINSLSVKLNSMSTHGAPTRELSESRPRGQGRHSEQPISRKEGRKNKEKRDSDVSDFTASGGKAQLLRNRYSLSIDKNTNNNNNLQSLLEKEREKYKQETDTISNHGRRESESEVVIPRRLSLKNIVMKPLFHHQPDQNSNEVAFSRSMMMSYYY